MAAHLPQMNGDGDPPGPDLEEGIAPASPRVSMASQRRRPAAVENEQTALSPKTSHNDSLEKAKPLPSAHRSVANPHGLITYAELPEWYKDNEYILAYYRPESHSWLSCLRSLFYLHNESVNIYTHLLPALLCVAAQGFMYHALSRTFAPHIQTLDYVVFGFYLLCACLMFSLSTTYHTLMNHSRNVSFLWLRLDYLGILVSILGAFVSGLRVGFYCDPTLQKVYWSMVRNMLFSSLDSCLWADLVCSEHYIHSHHLLPGHPPKVFPRP